MFPLSSYLNGNFGFPLVIPTTVYLPVANSEFEYLLVYIFGISTLLTVQTFKNIYAFIYRLLYVSSKL
ncbi:hypothetical protein SDC9_206983 [bioreactor metagenome]|uniref:Uncharacterized protein n=1 Tax=bioreactor metagenome TaxID=1076179 RepID=A0A645J805_9ZZZZ